MKLLLVLALCLLGGAAVRGDASAGQTVYTATGGALPGVPAQGGVLGTLKVRARRGKGNERALLLPTSAT